MQKSCIHTLCFHFGINPRAKLLKIFQICKYSVYFYGVFLCKYVEKHIFGLCRKILFVYIKKKSYLCSRFLKSSHAIPDIYMYSVTDLFAAARPKCQAGG